MQLRNLSGYRNSHFELGATVILRLGWYVLSLIVFESGWFPMSGLKVALLRAFGSNIGRGVVIKPHVRIKFPWRLTVGDHCWIGQDVWIDNLADVTLESDVCISQGAYLCTGSHDHRSPTFELKTAPILVKHGAWIAAKAIVLQGAVIEVGEVVPAGTVVGKRGR
jgi:putative colanic acid biosynthesis acetyltransferase WcaF